MENIVLVKFLGLCPFFGVSRKFSNVFGLGGAVTIILVISCFVGWVFYHSVLVPLNLGSLFIVSTVMVIFFLVTILRIVTEKYLQHAFHFAGKFFPMLASNCLILGIVFLVIQENYTLTESLVTAFAGGIGFSLVLFMMSGIKEKLDDLNIPRPFQGMPIALITASLIALAFMGFVG